MTQITGPPEQMDDTPTVQTAVLKNGRYVQVLGLMHEPILDLTSTEALNLAMRLIEEAGTNLNAQLADALTVST